MLFTRLDHVAFRVDDIRPVVDFYTNQLGYRLVQEMTLDLGGSTAISNVLQLEGNPFYVFVDQGLEDDNIISKWVKTFGNRLHHMAYLVENIYETWEQLKFQGVEFTSEKVIDTGGGLKQLFTHPNPFTGLITEIIQRDKENIFFVQNNVIELIKSTEGLESRH